MKVQLLEIQTRTNAMEKFMKLIEKNQDKNWNWGKCGICRKTYV